MNVSSLRTAFVSRFALPVLVAIVAGVASAQDASSPAPPHPPGLSGALLDANVHAALGLDTLQETQWQQLSQNSASLRSTLKASHDQARAVVDAELAKASPDFGTIESTLESTQASAQTAVHALEQSALVFYATLSSSQQAIVVAAFKAQASRPHEPRPAA